MDNNLYKDLNIKNIQDNLDNLKTDSVIQFVEGQLGRDNLGKLTREWWTDFFIGASLQGIAAGTIRKL